MGSGSHATGAREREVHIRTLLQQTPVPLDELRQLVRADPVPTPPVSPCWIGSHLVHAFHHSLPLFGKTRRCPPAAASSRTSCGR